MAIKVTFNAKNELGRDFTLIDTYSNVKIVAKGLNEMFDAMDRQEKKLGDKMGLLDYEGIIDEYTIKNVTRILGLNAKDAKKLENMSKSDVAEFYQKLVSDFIQMDVPSISAMKNVMNQAAALQAGNDTDTNDNITPIDSAKDPK